MRKTKASGISFAIKNADSFTLIELLTVMAIIAILAALILAAGIGVIKRSMRSRASAEIQAISTALESYKTDNGSYPASDPAIPFSMATSTLLTNNAASPYLSATTDGSTASSVYVSTSQTLYLALTGQTNFSDNPVAGNKTYLSLKRNQTADATGGTYIKDPWNYSYGYSIGSATSYPFSGTGFFDLWSTGGLLAGPATNTAAWLCNWQ